MSTVWWNFHNNNKGYDVKVDKNLKVRVLWEKSRGYGTEEEDKAGEQLSVHLNGKALEDTD